MSTINYEVMKLFLTIPVFSFFLSLSVFSQEKDVKVGKDNIVSVDGVSVFKLVSTKIPDAYTVYNLNDEKLIIFNFLAFNDPSQVSSSNPKGSVQYFDVTFINDELSKCEIGVPGFKKQLAKQIVADGLVVDGKLDSDAVKLFCRVNGTRYSELRQRPGTTVIINNK